MKLTTEIHDLIAELDALEVQASKISSKLSRAMLAQTENSLKVCNRYIIPYTQLWLDTDVMSPKEAVEYIKTIADNGALVETHADADTVHYDFWIDSRRFAIVLDRWEG